MPTPAPSSSSPTRRRPRRGSRPLWSFRERFQEARKIMPAATADPLPAPEETGWIEVWGPGHSRKQVRDAVRSLQLRNDGSPKETHPDAG
jgi:hypothetical protein